MTELTFSPEFEPYVNPEFWGGHMIDDGDAIGRWDLAQGYGPADRQSNRYAREVLKHCLPQMRGLTPLRTFQSGSEFDASEHPAGTVLLYKSHSLRTVPENTARKMQNSSYYTDSHEPSMNLNFGFYEGMPKKRMENQLLHTVRTQWGVVSRTNDGEPVIASFDQASVYRLSSAQVKVGYPSTRAKQPQIKIGETSHFELAKGHEELEKVTQLYICGYGKAKKARKTGKQLVNSLIPKPVISRPAIGLA